MSLNSMQHVMPVRPYSPIPTNFTDQGQIWHVSETMLYSSTPNFTVIGIYWYGAD